MNDSKKRDLRCWKKWYQSGAIKQPVLEKELVVDAKGIFTGGKNEGNVTLTLSEKKDAPTPTMAVVVPFIKGQYDLGMKLKELPKNAVPTNVFFI